MRNNMVTFSVIFCGVWAFVGTVFLAIGFGLLKSKKNKEINCTSRTTGKVVGLEKRTSGSMNRGYIGSYHPVFEYCVDGNTITKESVFGSNPIKLYGGQQITVCYNPSDPNEYYVEEEKTGKILGVVFTVIGIVCIVVCLLAAIIIGSINASF